MPLDKLTDAASQADVIDVVVNVGAVLSKVVVTAAVEVQPLLPVTVTVNVPAVLTVIAAVETLVLQE